jgi:HSP20 family protein
MPDIRPTELRGPGAAFLPTADVVEMEGVLVIRLAVPGVLEEDIDVSFEGGGLTVRGELVPPVVVDEGRSILREWRYGLFERHFDLTGEFDSDRFSVEVEFGVLEIRIPRSE